MENNGISSTIKIVGILDIVFGIIGSIILTTVFEDVTFLFVGIVVSVISGIFIIGFSEIINLLQQSIYNQQIIINHLNGTDNNHRNTTNSEEDITLIEETLSAEEVIESNPSNEKPTQLDGPNKVELAIVFGIIIIIVIFGFVATL